MFPWSAIIGLAGQAASGIMSAVNNKKKAQEEDAAAARREAHYEAQANENPLSRSDNRAMLAQYDRDAKKQVENAKNTATIMGMTPEYSVAVQEGVAEGKANLMSNMSANNQERVDKAREKAEEAREAGEARKVERRAERNATYAQLAANAANAVGSIADAYSADKVGGGSTTTGAPKSILDTGGSNGAKMTTGKAVVQGANGDRLITTYGIKPDTSKLKVKK